MFRALDFIHVVVPFYFRADGSPGFPFNGFGRLFDHLCERIEALLDILDILFAERLSVHLQPFSDLFQVEFGRVIETPIFTEKSGYIFPVDRILVVVAHRVGSQ